MIKLFKYIQFLSLDVVAGALLSSAFVAKIFELDLSTPVLIGLGIAIWLIYTADHLMDAYRIKGRATNPRHAFHQRYFKAMIIISLVVFGLGICNIFYLPWNTVKIGSGLILFVGLYFLTTQLTKSKSVIHKEVSAALIYSFGIFAGPISLMNTFDQSFIFLFGQFFLIALLNLLIFPLYEIESDREDQMKSLVLKLGGERMKRIIHWAFGISLIMLLIGFFYINPVANQMWLSGQWILFFMLLVLYGLFMKPDTFRPYNLYRVFGDGIFFLPGLILL